MAVLRSKNSLMIKFYFPRWGFEHIEWNTFCGMVASEGYDGIEYGVPSIVDDTELDYIWNCVGRHRLKIIAGHYDTLTGDFGEHYELYGRWLERIKMYPAEKILSQTGRDFFSFEQNLSLIELAASSGLNILHETHRGRFSSAPHLMKEFFDACPSLKINFDVSHWLCVTESYLDQQEEALQLAISRSAHIHARVGHTEGPQVSDFREPEWDHALKKHLSWWDEIVKGNRDKKWELTIGSEFGPYPYMARNHQTGLPIANQWELNLEMTKMLKKRYV